MSKEDVQWRYGFLLKKARPVIELVEEFPEFCREHSIVADWALEGNWNGHAVMNIKDSVDRAIEKEGFVMTSEQQEVYGELKKAFKAYKWAEENNPNLMRREAYIGRIAELVKKYGIVRV